MGINIDKRDRLLFVLFSLLIYTYVLSYIQGHTESNIQYIIMILILGYIIAFKSDSKIYISKELELFYLYLFIGYILIPSIQLFLYKDINVLLFSILNLVYILFLCSFCYYVAKNNKVREMIIVFWMTTTIILIYQLLNSDTNIFDLSNIGNLFNRDLRSKNNFGFNSTNSVSNICYGNLIAAMFFKFKNKLLNVLRVLLEAIILLILIQTSSRTPIICLGIFFIVYLIMNIFNRFKSSSKNNIKIISILLILIILVLKLFTFTFDFEHVNYITSGRLLGWKNTLNYLINNNDILIGLGLLNPSNLYGGKYPWLMADNWYLYTTITIGITGLICNLVMISILYLRLRIIRNFRYNMLIRSFFISKLFYAFFEITFFTTSDTTSLLLFLIVFSMIYKDNIDYNT